MIHLVLQGNDPDTGDLKRIAKLTSATMIEQITPTAFRLRDAKPVAELQQTCNEAKLDYAYVPADRRLSAFRLLALDMDSTLITVETIDELADMQGLKPEVAAVTAAAMRGEIEYDESLRRRVGLLKGLDASALERVYRERLILSPGAEKLIAAAHTGGLKVLLVSGGFAAITERQKARLGLDYTYSNTLGVEDGRLTGTLVGQLVNADAKRDRLLGVRDELGATSQQIIAVGDGANDLKFMGEAGVSIAYHAKPVVREKATYCLDYVGLDGLLNLYA
ncbi:MAG TPA: phosphoserine phosphatase SerB [Burkholderiales bacterium]|nr:phosphoserine phosphatase SerB [Burkholderiales bacterium]